MDGDALPYTRTADLVADELRAAEHRFLQATPGTPERARLVRRVRRLTDELVSLLDVDAPTDEHVDGPIRRTGRLLSVTLVVPDIAAAVRFYRDVVGLAVAREHPGAGPDAHNVAWGFPDAGLMFTLASGSPREPLEIAFLVDDLDGVHARALATATAVIAPPEPGPLGDGAWRTCELRDPAGNVVVVQQAPSEATDRLSPD